MNGRMKKHHTTIKDIWEIIGAAATKSILFVVTAISFTFSLVVFGQQDFYIRPEIKSIVDSIAMENQLNCSKVGMAGRRTAQWSRYEKLLQMATKAELRNLSYHLNSVVRCYSFQALVERKDTMVFAVLSDHLHDTSLVVVVDGCVGMMTYVGDFFIDAVTLVDSLHSYSISQRQKHELDSILLFDTRIKLHAKEEVLRTIPPNPDYHLRIRQIAEVEGIPEAAVALARFKDTADIPIIKSFFMNKHEEYYAVYAAKVFPHAEFYEDLLRIFKREFKGENDHHSLWRVLYQAFVQYDHKNTLYWLKKTIHVKDETKRETLGKYLLLALMKYPWSKYTSLKEKIQLDGDELKSIEYEINLED